MAQPVCFTCGLSVGEPHRLNRLDNGQVCPTCRERVLDTLPPILPDLPGAKDRAAFSPPTSSKPPEEFDDFVDPPAAS